MDTVDKIAIIDAKFADAIRNRDVHEIILKSPWAWLEHELYRVPGIDKSDFGPEKIPLEAAIGVYLEVRSDVSTRHVLSNLTKKSRLKVIKRGFLVYRDASQVKARILLEYNAEGYRPTWLKVLKYLCEHSGEHTMKEIETAIGAKIMGYHILDDAPQLFWNSTREILTNLKTNPKRIIKPEFYSTIYLKIRPWLSEEGYKVFEEWKARYNQ